MADIIFSDNIKRDIKLASWYLRRKYAEGNTKKTLHEDIVACGNPVVKILYDIMNDSSDKIQMKYHRELSKELTEVLLWIVYKDTAYRDVLFYTIKKLLDKKEDIMPVLDRYYKEPDSWYVNLWKASKDATKNERAEGTITSQNMSYAEEIFTPAFEQNEINRFLKEIDEEKKKRHWFNK